MTTVDKADLEAKLREIEGVVLDAEESARSKAIMVGVTIAVVIGVVGYGLWRARRNKIKVEVYRL
jgi:hypothetical protein